jgi:transposase
MERYPEGAWERAMKIQELILRAMAKKITWWQAAEIIGISDRSLHRWRERYEEHGYDGLLDRRRGKPSPQRVPLRTVEEVLRLYESATTTSTCGTFTRSWWKSTAWGSVTRG